MSENSAILTIWS